MKINQEINRFCPYCSNPNATDGSYQEIGCFSIMEQEITFNGCEVTSVQLVCPHCYHREYNIEVSDYTKKIMFLEICNHQ